MDGENKLIIPALGCIYRALGPLSYLGLRIAVGGVIMSHGYAKLFNGFAPMVAEKTLTPLGVPMPYAVADFLGCLELFGSALLVIGLLTRPIALMLFVQFVVIAFGVQIPRGWSEGAEYVIVMMMTYAVFAANGAGRYSVDRLIGKEF